MEFIPGENLRQFVKTHSLSLKQKMEICLQITDALQFLHKNNIVHRDISAKNCLVNIHITILIHED